MQLIQYTDVKHFTHRVCDFLLRHEALHNSMLSLCHSLQQLSQPPKQPPLLITVEAKQAIVAVAMKVPRGMLFTSTVTDMAAIEILARHLVNDQADLSSVNAPTPVSQAFAQQWSELTGQAYTLDMTLYAFQLEKLSSLTCTNGQLRQATTADRPLLSQWYAAFTLEAFGIQDANNDTWTERQIQQGTAYLWENGERVSMACRVGTTPNGARISIVYTPPQYRQQGYGKACTATLTQLLLAQGNRYCFLYADKANPISNQMYEAIGYQVRGELQNYSFATRIMNRESSEPE